MHISFQRCKILHAIFQSHQRLSVYTLCHPFDWLLTSQHFDRRDEKKTHTPAKQASNQRYYAEYFASSLESSLMEDEKKVWMLLQIKFHLRVHHEHPCKRRRNKAKWMRKTSEHDYFVIVTLRSFFSHSCSLCLWWIYILLTSIFFLRLSIDLTVYAAVAAEA